MCLMLPVGTAVAWWLAFGKGTRRKAVVETLVTLPLVLPPTVIGYYLLLVFGNGTSFGRFVNDTLNVHLLFTWQGAAVAAAVMASPLYIRTVAAALAAVDPELLEWGRTVGATEPQIFARVTLPLAYRGVCVGVTLAVARALGEFGATLIVAASLPNRTQTLPLALYDAVQTGNDSASLFYTLVLTGVAFVLLGIVAAFQTRIATRRN